MFLINIKKYYKLHKSSIKFNFLNRNNKLNFSKFFLKSLSYVRISIKQIELARRFIVRKTNKFSFNSLKIKPFFFFTKKSKKSRMGKGIGSVNSLEYNVRPGTIIFEMISISFKNSFSILLNASKKLPGFYKVYFFKKLKWIWNSIMYGLYIKNQFNSGFSYLIYFFIFSKQ